MTLVQSFGSSTNFQLIIADRFNMYIDDCGTLLPKKIGFTMKD